MGLIPGVLNGGALLEGPAADGSASQVIVTNGSGKLVFRPVTVDASGNLTASGTGTFGSVSIGGNLLYPDTHLYFRAGATSASFILQGPLGANVSATNGVRWQGRGSIFLTNTSEFSFRDWLDTADAAVKCGNLTASGTGTFGTTGISGTTGNVVTAQGKNGSKVELQVSSAGAAHAWVTSVGASVGAYNVLQADLETFQNFLTNSNTTGLRWMRFGNLNNFFRLDRISDDGSTILASSILSIANNAPSGSLAIATSGAVSFAGRVESTAAGTSNSQGKFGSFEIQSYAVNNAWLGENVYYSGSVSDFTYRANGYGVVIRSIYGGVQIETCPSGTAGAAATPTIRAKFGQSGEFGIGGAISSGSGTYSGAAIVGDSSKNLTFAANATVVGTIYVGSTANEIWSQYGYLNLRNTGGNGVTIQDGSGYERIKVSGSTVTLNGNTYAGHLKVLGNAGNTYDIGENTYRFRDGYFAGTLYSGSFSGAALSVTTGVSSTGYIIAYGNSVALNYNGASIRLPGSQAIAWGSSLDSAWRTRLYESAAGTLTIDNGSGGSATLAVTGTLQSTSSDGAINKFTTYGQLELGFGATYPAIFFGGRDTASRPKLSVSGTNLQWMLTDESAFAPIMGSEVVARTMSALTARLTTFSGYIGTVDVSEDGTNYAARMKADEGLKLGVNRMIKFGPNAAVGSEDVGICRNSAGLLEINNSTSGTYRDLRLRNIEVVGDLGVAESLTFTEVNNGNSGTSKTIAWGNGNHQFLTLTGNVTLTFTDPPASGRFTLVITQDGTGGHTVTWPASVKWPGGAAPTISAGANAVDIVTLVFRGTTYYASISQNFS